MRYSRLFDFINQSRNGLYPKLVGSGRLDAKQTSLCYSSIALERFLFFVRSLNPMVTRFSSISSLVKPLGAMVVVLGGGGVRGAGIEVCCGFQKCYV